MLNSLGGNNEELYRTDIIKLKGYLTTLEAARKRRIAAGMPGYRHP